MLGVSRPMLLIVRSATNHLAAQVVLDAGIEVSHSFADGRRAWLQVVRGAVSADGMELATGDGLPLSEPGRLVLSATADAEVLLFDMG